MKKTLLTIALAGMMLFSQTGFAQPTEQPALNSEETNEISSGTEKVDSSKVDSTETGSEPSTTTSTNSTTGMGSNGAKAAGNGEVKEDGTQMIKRYFIEGGWEFMSVVLLCLVLGLAFAIERLVVLTLKQINSKRFVTQIEGKLAKGDVEGAKEIARNTPGPIASIYYQGLDRSEEGIDIVEKSIVSYGSVQMGLLEKGLVWISLFISLAPMLGFMGTVIGMIMAFDKIEAMGDIEPSAVAGGIKVALLTTVAGLIVAIILQIFYNLIVSIIDSMVNNMEDASITLVDMMIKYNIVKGE